MLNQEFLLHTLYLSSYLSTLKQWFQCASIDLQVTNCSLLFPFSLSLGCTRPTVVQHGDLLNQTEANRGSFPPGTLLMYGCEPGYIIDGPTSIICTSSGVWSPQPPRCIRSNSERTQQYRTFNVTCCGTQDCMVHREAIFVLCAYIQPSWKKKYHVTSISLSIILPNTKKYPWNPARQHFPQSSVWAFTLLDSNLTTGRNDAKSMISKEQPSFLNVFISLLHPSLFTTHWTRERGLSLSPISLPPPHPENSHWVLLRWGLCSERRLQVPHLPERRVGRSYADQLPTHTRFLCLPQQQAAKISTKFLNRIFTSSLSSRVLQKRSQHLRWAYQHFLSWH